MLEEMFFRARRLYEEHQLAPPIQLLTRNSSDKAARVYYAMYTLLQASISASQADKLERYIRAKAPQLPPHFFDLKEWEPSLSIARLVRTHELKDARMQLMGQRKQLAAELVDASDTLRAMGKDLAALKATALRDAAALRHFMDTAQAAVLGVVEAFTARQDDALRAHEAAARRAARDLADEQQRAAQGAAALAALEGELAAAKEGASALRKRVKALEVREKELLQRAEEAEDNAQAAVKKSNKAVREATASLADAEAQLAAAVAEANQLREEVLRLRDAPAKLAAAHATAKELEATVAALRGAAQEHTAEAGNLRQSMDRLQQSFREDAARAAEEAEAQERLRAEEMEAEIGRRVSGAQAEWSASQRQALDASAKEGSDQQERVGRLEAELADERARAAGVEAAAQERGAVAAALQADLDAWKARAVRAEAAAAASAPPPAAAAVPDARVQELEAALRQQAADHAAAVAALRAEADDWQARAAAATAAAAAAHASPGGATHVPDATQPVEVAVAPASNFEVVDDQPAPRASEAPAAPVPEPADEPAPTPSAAAGLPQESSSEPLGEEGAAGAAVMPGAVAAVDADVDVDALPAADVPAAVATDSSSSAAAPVDATEAAVGAPAEAPAAAAASVVNEFDMMSLSDCSEMGSLVLDGGAPTADESAAAAAAGGLVDPAAAVTDDAAAVAAVAAAAAAAEVPANPATAVAQGTVSSAAPGGAPAEPTNEAEGANGRKMSKRRASMMAMPAGEEGEEEEEDDDAPELTELEDKFLTAVAYNKVRARVPDEVEDEKTWVRVLPLLLTLTRLCPVPTTPPRRRRLGQDTDVKDCLKKDPSVVNVRNSFGRDAMQISARNGNTDMMDVLVKVDRTAAETNTRRWMPFLTLRALFLTPPDDSPARCQRLDAGEERRHSLPPRRYVHPAQLYRRITHLTCHHSTPLHCFPPRPWRVAVAAYNGKLKVVKWLIKSNHKELARAVDSDGRTAVHVAARRGEMDIATLLQVQRRGTRDGAWTPTTAPRPPHAHAYLPSSPSTGGRSAWGSTCASQTRPARPCTKASRASARTARSWTSSASSCAACARSWTAQTGRARRCGPSSRSERALLSQLPTPTKNIVQYVHRQRSSATTGRSRRRHSTISTVSFEWHNFAVTFHTSAIRRRVLSDLRGSRRWWELFVWKPLCV